MQFENINFEDFPEHKPGNRVKLSYKWLPEKINTLLDGGCSYGYGTKYLAEKSNKTFAIDVNPLHIYVAKQRYKHINFEVKPLEYTEFPDEYFDAIVLNDVLEHTNDKIQTLNEMYRILKPNGTLIISTPHKGLFAFLDPYNYGYFLQKYLNPVYRILFKLVRFLKEGKIPNDFNPEHKQKHYHYSLNDFHRMLNKTQFKGNYHIEKVFRSGLLIEVLVMNLESVLKIFFPQRLIGLILKPLRFVAEKDYWIPYGKLSYNIAIKVCKKDKLII